MAMRAVMISCVSFSPLELANDTIEQYREPISEDVVDSVIRWKPRMVVDGGRKEKRLMICTVSESLHGSTR